MDETLRKILMQRRCHAQVNEFFDQDLMALSRRNLARIEPGMYWYDDDTFSSRLRPEKKLKSIVLFVKDDIIYGDSFKQCYMLGCNVPAYFKAREKEYSFLSGLLYYPQTQDLQKVQEAFQKINAACKKSGKPVWSEEVYLAEKSSDEYLRWVDMLDGDDGKISIENGAYFRPLIACLAV